MENDVQEDKGSGTVVPHEIAYLFWDADLEKLDLWRHRRYIIERALELGAETTVQWLFSVYGESEIKDAVRGSRRLSRKTASCWQNFFLLREEEMRCFGTFSMNPDGYY